MYEGDASAEFCAYGCLPDREGVLTCSLRIDACAVVKSEAEAVQCLNGLQLLQHCGLLPMVVYLFALLLQRAADYGLRLFCVWVSGNTALL